MRATTYASLCALLACTGHVHEDVHEPEIDEAELEEADEHPDRWKGQGGDWAEASSPAEQAKDLFRVGLESYKRGEYEAALDSFRAAYELEPAESLLYNVAMCLERMGRTADAIAELDALANAAADPSLRAQAAQRRDELRSGQ